MADHTLMSGRVHNHGQGCGYKGLEQMEGREFTISGKGIVSILAKIDNRDIRDIGKLEPALLVKLVVGRVIRGKTTIMMTMPSDAHVQ